MMTFFVTYIVTDVKDFAEKQKAWIQTQEKICVKIATFFFSSSSFYINDLIVYKVKTDIYIMRTIQLSKKDLKVYS